MPDVPGTTEAPLPADAVAALARQVERLEARVDGLGVDRIQADLRSVSATLSVLADEVAEIVVTSAGDEAALSWLWSRDVVDADEALAVLQQLMRWAVRVYLRYADAALPECWLWHPDVIEELVWLRSAWQAAYHGPMASALRAGDWHDRFRPGVVRRLRAAAGDCSLREHFEKPTWPVVPVADAAPAIATWWAEPGDPAPVPSGDQVAAADAAHRRAPHPATRSGSGWG